MTSELSHHTRTHKKYTNTEEQHLSQWGGKRQVTEPHTNTHREDYEEIKAVLTLFTVFTEAQRYTSVSEDTRSTLPRGRSGAVFPLEPLKMDVGFILLYIYASDTHAHTHKCHTNPKPSHSNRAACREKDGVEEKKKKKEKKKQQNENKGKLWKIRKTCNSCF